MNVTKTLIENKLKDAVTVSKKYMVNIKRSVTETKKNYYTKKLKKNNKIVAKLVIVLDKIEKKCKNN